MTAEIEGFIRQEASLRGIDPDTAIAVAMSEGGVDELAPHGSFPTGDSWWAFQLHYGGPAYPQFGAPGQSVAGMGNDFSALTGWAPGDPAAWRDACRYALNRAKEQGWDAWYGAAAIGITGFDGIDRGVPWDPNCQTWDYESGGGTVTAPSYNALQPAFAQNDDWSCSCTSARWMLWAFGREPSEQWIESEMLADGIVSTQLGLLDASGGQLAAWLVSEYGPAEYGGYTASNDPSVSFDDVLAEAAELSHPAMIGGRSWCHWSGVRGAADGRLLLANPASGWMGVTQSMTRAQFQQLGPFSLVRLTHPGSVGPVPPQPADPGYAPPGSVGSGILEMMTADDTTAAAPSTWLPLGAAPAMIEECVGMNGVTYRFHLPTGNRWRYAPS